MIYYCFNYRFWFSLLCYSLSLLIENWSYYNTRIFLFLYRRKNTYSFISIVFSKFLFFPFFLKQENKKYMALKKQRKWTKLSKKRIRSWCLNQVLTMNSTDWREAAPKPKHKYFHRAKTTKILRILLTNNRRNYSSIAMRAGWRLLKRIMALILDTFTKTSRSKGSSKTF